MKFCKRCGLEKSMNSFRADPRYKSGVGSWCVDCHKSRNSEWAKENRERLTAKAAAWRASNKEKAIEIHRNFHERNKEKRSKAAVEWAKRNPEKRRASDAKHRAAKIQATPSWVDLVAIAKFYADAPAGYQVDHIVPLVSDLVCGLHCLANLQYLTPRDNQSKRNWWWPQMHGIEDAQRQGRLFA